MIESILTSVKKNLGLAADYEAFDPDIVMYINGALARLTQLGVGPEQGFRIEDADATWGAFIGTDPNLSPVKEYVTLHTKMLFDPPGTSYLLGALTKQLEKLEWTINMYMELTIWEDPTPRPIVDTILDGGAP